MNAITLAILGGGEGSRMGGPKAWLRVDGRPILEYLLDRWRWLGPTMLVTAPGREHPPKCERFDSEVTDAIRGEGPMRGVLTAIEHCRTDRLIVLPCDMPLMSREALEWHARLLDEDPERYGIMTRSRDGAIEPFPLALRIEAISLLRDRLGEQQRSIQSLSTSPHFALKNVPENFDPRLWTNINTPADWKSFLDR